MSVSNGPFLDDRAIPASLTEPGAFNTSADVYPWELERDLRDEVFHFK